MLITELKQVEGKTIKRAVTTGAGDTVVLLFSDGDCASMEARQNYDLLEIVLDDSISNYNLFAVGAISEDEFDHRIEAAHSQRAVQIRCQEMATLARLKEKYE